MAIWAERRVPSDVDGWVTLAYAAIAIGASAVTGWLALPATRPNAFDAFQQSDFLRPSWLVVGLLTAYPIHRVARSSWLAGAALFVLVTAEAWYVVATAVEAMASAGLDSSLTQLWFGLVAVYAAVIGTAAGSGGLTCVRRRRWVRRMRADAPELERIPVERDAPPAWRDGFYST